jgi:hypothetical protein
MVVNVLVKIACVDVGKWWELIVCVDVQVFGYW